MRKASKSLGLTQVPLKDSEAANGMTALYFPVGVTAADLLPRLVKKDVVVAGGLHVDIKGISPYYNIVRITAELWYRSIFHNRTYGCLRC
jgi:aspartate aminotransferase-like enzyme